MEVRVWVILDRTIVSRNLMHVATQKTLDESAGLLYLFRHEVEYNERRLKAEYGEGIKIKHRFQKDYHFDFVLLSSAEVPDAN